MKTRPYGSWKSPVEAIQIATGTVRFGMLAVEDETTYWVELRPQEQGRCVVARHTPEHGFEDINPAPFNARTRVHEYGGGAFHLAAGVLYFANFADQRIYAQAPGEEPQAVTGEDQRRFADFFKDPARQRLISVCEDHSAAETEPTNTIASIALDGSGAIYTLVEGADFYSSPRLSSNGDQLAWLSWDHPNMPWDSATLWVASVDIDGSVGPPQRVAGGSSESIFQPEWSPAGELHFISDRNNWWNIHRWRGGKVECVYEAEAEFGFPQWLFGMSTYGFAPTGEIICSWTKAGVWHLGQLSPETGVMEVKETPFTQISQLRVSETAIVVAGASTTAPPVIARCPFGSEDWEVLRQSSSVQVDPAFLSSPSLVEFPTTGERTAFGFFYPPSNRDHRAPPGERPPLLVMSHGGPTSATSSSLSLAIQFWCSRGIAVLDVNYGGSTGFGRRYRERLEGTWGVTDVDDCVAGARYLVEQGAADGSRMAIRGGSAGGYTTLCALTFRDVFKAGASYFGVSDLDALMADTHKFESRYLESLIGPYTSSRALFRERSPIHSAAQLSCPIVFFQGLEDEVVPPNQSELMVNALRKKKLPVAYVAFEGEQHGFRKAENIQRSLEGELYFYSRVFGFELAGDIQTIDIENLPAHG